MLFFLMISPLTGFTESIVLNNQAFNSADKKMAIQWACSAKDVEADNLMLKQGETLNPAELNVLTRAGKITLNIPDKAGYFRVLVWSKGTKKPDFLTNWVDIESNKIYTLNKEHLISYILMTGTGC